MEITENLPNIEPIKPNEKSSSNMDARLAQLLCMLTETTQSCTQMLNEMNRKQKEEKENLAGKKASNANWHCTWDVGTGFISGLLAFTSGGQTASQAVTGITHGGDSVFQNNGSQLQEESQKLEKQDDKSSELKRSLQDTNRQLGQAVEKLMEEDKHEYKKGIGA